MAEAQEQRAKVFNHMSVLVCVKGFWCWQFCESLNNKLPFAVAVFQFFPLAKT